MRSFCFVVCLFCLQTLGAGCSDEGAAVDPGVALIRGSWTWQRSEGFHTQGIVPPSPDHVSLPEPGFRLIIRFAINGEYSETVNGVTTLHARYELKAEGNYCMIVYSDVTLTSGGIPDALPLVDQLVVVMGDTLRLRDVGPSGSLQTYARLR